MASDGLGKVRTKKSKDCEKPYNRSKSLLKRFGSSLRDYFMPSWYRPTTCQSLVDEDELAKGEIGAVAIQVKEAQGTAESRFNRRLSPAQLGKSSVQTTADGIVVECDGYQATFDHSIIGDRLTPGGEMTSFTRPPLSSGPVPRDSLGTSCAGFSFTKQPMDVQPSTSMNSLETPSAAGFSFGVHPSERNPSTSRDALETPSAAGFSFGVHPSERNPSTSRDPLETPSAAGFSFGVHPSERNPSTSRDSLETPSAAGFSFGVHPSVHNPSTLRDSREMSTAGFSFMTGKRAAPLPSGEDSSSEVSEKSSQERFETPFKKQCVERPFKPSAITGSRDSASSSGSTRRTLPGEQSFLWSTKLNSSNVTSSASGTFGGKKPRFDMETFNSTLRNSSDASLLSSNHKESPYYLGKTTYGGASARQKLFKHLDTQYQVVPTVRQKVRIEPAGSTASRVTLSATALRILEGLEQFEPGQQPEQKSVPAIGSSLVDSPLSFTPSAFRRSSLQAPGRPVFARTGPPVHDLPIPTFAIIRNNIQAFQNEPVERSEAAKRKATVDVPSTATDTTTTSTFESARAPGKMRRERTSRRMAGNDGEEEEEGMEPDYELSTIKLPTANLQPFTTSMLHSSTVAPMNWSASDVKAGSQKTSAFTFSLPISVCNSNCLTTELKPKNFQFRSPIAVGDDVKPCVSAPMDVDQTAAGVTSTSSGKSSLTMNFNLNAAVKKSPPLTSSSGAAEIPSFGLAPASHLKQGSIMDFLGGTNIAPTRTSVVPLPGSVAVSSTHVAAAAVEDNRPLAEVFKAKTGNWSCPECFVTNGNDASECPCCYTKKPESKPMASHPTSTTPVTFTQVPVSVSTTVSAVPPRELLKKPSVDKWTCPKCFVQSDSGVSKCLRCTTKEADAEKPMETADTGKSAEVSTTSTNLSSLATLFKKAPGEWACSTCYVSNKAEDLKCMACDEPKPRAKPPTSLPDANNRNANASATNSGAVDGSGFKFNASAFGNGSRPTFGAVPSDAPSVAVAPTGGFKINLPTTAFSGFAFGASSSQPTSSQDKSASFSGFASFGQTNNATSNGENGAPTSASATTATATVTSSEKPIVAAPSFTLATGISPHSFGNGSFKATSEQNIETKSKPAFGGFGLNVSDSGLAPGNAVMLPSFSSKDTENASAISQRPALLNAEKGSSDEIQKSENASNLMGNTKPSGIFASSVAGLDRVNSSTCAITAPSFSFGAHSTSSGPQFGLSETSTEPTQSKFGFAATSAPLGVFGSAPATASSALPRTSSQTGLPLGANSTVTPAPTGFFAQPAAAVDKLPTVEPPKPNLPIFGQIPSSTTDAVSFKFGQDQPSQEVKPAASNNLFVFGQTQNSSSNNVFQFGRGSNSVTPSDGPFNSAVNHSVPASSGFGAQTTAQPFKFGAPTGSFTFGAAPSEVKPAPTNLLTLQGTKRPFADDDSTTKRVRQSTEEMQMQDEPASASASGGFSFSQSHGFGFGATQPPASNSGFFGARPLNPTSAFPMPSAVPTPAAPSSFTFTRQPPQTSVPVFGVQNVPNLANGAVNTGLGFGSGASTTPSAPVGFNFNSALPSFNFSGTPSNQPTNVSFNAAPGTSTMQGRTFKKAVRRTQKHN